MVGDGATRVSEEAAGSRPAHTVATFFAPDALVAGALVTLGEDAAHHMRVRRLDAGDAQLLARYERWRGLDTFMVAAATDTLTRLFGIPGRAASAVRRFGIDAVDRIGPLKDRLMAEARGESGQLPKLLMGLSV